MKRRPKIGDLTGQVIKVRWSESELFMDRMERIERGDKRRLAKTRKPKETD